MMKEINYDFAGLKYHSYFSCISRLRRFVRSRCIITLNFLRNFASGFSVNLYQSWLLCALRPLYIVYVGRDPERRRWHLASPLALFVLTTCFFATVLAGPLSKPGPAPWLNPRQLFSISGASHGPVPETGPKVLSCTRECTRALTGCSVGLNPCGNTVWVSPIKKYFSGKRTVILR